MESSTEHVRVAKFSENLDLPQEVIDHPLSRSLEDCLREHDAHTASSTNNTHSLSSLRNTHKSTRKTNTSSTYQSGISDLKTSVVQRRDRRSQLLIYRQRLQWRYARMRIALCSKFRSKTPKTSGLKVSELKASEK
ncbi:hypothetical protein FIE12Z_4558 [Fusarium flagelliforme]|uniref:Uncharacterized protein n=1 Tax=Fusarium flagelliforme TaxID=2675880 RepID=A0A395MU08_9HYPO|nr:hypothetical protein FIE12Z_4558 [Fusarium flagelliforme]